MRKRCPTCNGLGRVPKVFPDGVVMGYCGPDGERWPHETCQNCWGSGWVGRSDNSAIDPADPAP